MTWIRFAIIVCWSVGLTMALPLAESNSDDIVVLHVEVPDSVGTAEGKTPKDHWASNENHVRHPFSQEVHEKHVNSREEHAKNPNTGKHKFSNEQHEEHLGSTEVHEPHVASDEEHQVALKPHGSSNEVHAKHLGSQIIKMGGGSSKL